MTTTLTFEQFYPADPDRLFALVIDLDTLDAVAWPFLQFHHLPSGPVREGQVIDMAVSLFGLLPARPYRIRITRCDPEARQMDTDEDGMAVRSLRHALEVRPEGAGAKLIDRIAIDAGWITPLAAAFVWASYRWRRHRRLGLLRAGQDRGR